MGNEVNEFGFEKGEDRMAVDRCWGGWEKRIGDKGDRPTKNGEREEEIEGLGKRQ